jgi:hypothetical protein
MGENCWELVLSVGAVAAVAVELGGFDEEENELCLEEEVPLRCRNASVYLPYE